MSNQAIYRITRELSDIQRNSQELSLAVACRDADVRNVKALVIGPPDTAYQFGFFDFDMKIDNDYPGKAPKVTAKTTNRGRTRFNPNIYSSGKVCLSILGTWRAETTGEQWSSAQGLESILISIQSLMSANPYENEPGFENARSTDDKKNMEAYNAKIRHETLRLSVIERLEEYLGISAVGFVEELPPLESRYRSENDEDIRLSEPTFEPFKDLCTRRFLWYYDAYLESITAAEATVHVDLDFTRMPFEGQGNQMVGKFNYTVLRRRLELIYDVIVRNTKHWAAEGLIHVKNESSLAEGLRKQYEQIVDIYKQNDTIALDLNLVDGNPFTWQLTYFGRPMTPLDGGMFNVRMHLSPRYPEEQPRVFVDTPLFHHRVSKRGILCYLVRRADDLKSHVAAIIDALEDTDTPYDPRMTVHPEASRLYWGTADQRKQYNRQLRRAVQRTME